MDIVRTVKHYMCTRANKIQNVLRMGSLATQGSKTADVKGNGLGMDVGLRQSQPIGEIIESTKPKNVPKLFTPLTIRDQTFPNRIMVIQFVNLIEVILASDRKFSKRDKSHEILKSFSSSK